jgi:hypothetical protein
MEMGYLVVVKENPDIFPNGKIRPLNDNNAIVTPIEKK